MTDTMTTTITKEIQLRAPRSRVWRALTNAEEFGTWFGVKLDGAFEAGRPISGTLTNPKYEHIAFEFVVDRVEPENYFSYRWHPFALDQSVDYSKEQKTLVEFRLTDTSDGTLLEVIESGFEHVPESRRDVAFQMNSKGWGSQLENIRRHVEK